MPLKKKIIYGILIIVLLVIGGIIWLLTNRPITPEEMESCQTESDCVWVCGCGCINKKRNCEAPKEIMYDCYSGMEEKYSCACVDNQCKTIKVDMPAQEVTITTDKTEYEQGDEIIKKAIQESFGIIIEKKNYETYKDGINEFLIIANDLFDFEKPDYSKKTNIYFLLISLMPDEQNPTSYKKLGEFRFEGQFERFTPRLSSFDDINGDNNNEMIIHLDTVGAAAFSKSAIIWLDKNENRLKFIQIKDDSGKYTDLVLSEGATVMYGNGFLLKDLDGDNIKELINYGFTGGAKEFEKIDYNEELVKTDDSNWTKYFYFVYKWDKDAYSLNMELTLNYIKNQNKVY